MSSLCNCLSLKNDMSKCCRRVGGVGFVLENIATVLMDYFFHDYLFYFLSCYDFLWKAILCLPSDSEG